MTDRIVKTIELKAPVERVWRALTDHEEFGTWFRARLDTPFVPGQPVTGRITYPGYEHLRFEATVKRMEPPHLFSYTWHPCPLDPTADLSGEEPTLVEFRLEPSPAGTRLTVTESGFDALPPGRRDEAFRVNEGGWAEQLRHIEAHLAPHAA